MTHLEAANIIARAAPDASFFEREAIRRIAFHETNYGQGWRPGDPGHGSHNWGAMQCPSGYSGPSFRHQDSHADGRRYVTCFKAYATDVDGARDIWEWIKRRPNVRAAAATGSTSALATAMYHAGYFEGTSKDPNTAIQRYVARLDQAGSLGPVPGLPSLAPHPAATSPHQQVAALTGPHSPAWMSGRRT